MGLIAFGLLLAIVGIVAIKVIDKTREESHYKPDWDGKRAKVGSYQHLPKVLYALVFIPLILFTIVASTTRVSTGEIAVMTRFGRVTGQELGEGFHVKNPLDKANMYDVKVQKDNTEAAAASKDLQDVKGTLVVNYRLEAGQVSNTHQNVGVLYKEKLLDPAVQEVFKASTAKYDATQLITDRAAVKKDAYELLRDRLAPYGIIVQDLSIVNFSFSPEFTKAIEAKQVAQQQAEQAKFNAQKAKQDAEAEVNRAKGSAQAQKLQQQTLTPLLVQKQFIEKWDGKLPTVTGGGNLLDVTKLINE